MIRLSYRYGAVRGKREVVTVESWKHHTKNEAASTSEKMPSMANRGHIRGDEVVVLEGRNERLGRTVICGSS